MPSRVHHETDFMPTTEPLSIDADGVLDLLQQYDALRIWEVLRTARAVLTISELMDATGLTPATLHRHLHLLVRHDLVKSIRARKPRRSVGYRASVDRIVVVFDDQDPESIARATQSSQAVRREFDRCLAECADPEFEPKAGFRFALHSMQHFTDDDFAELRRRMLSVIDMLSAPRPVHPRPATKGERPPFRPDHCNQAISIRLEPLVGPLLPLPAVWMTPRRKLDRGPAPDADTSGLSSLTPREREVALARADGLTRAHAAERMGVSVHTIATLARRVYRKLGVSSQAALASRLSGHPRREVGD